MGRKRAAKKVASTPVTKVARTAVPYPGVGTWEALRYDVMFRDAAEQRVGEGVRALRAAGATWTELAEVLGVTRQAVAKRYGEPL